MFLALTSVSISLFDEILPFFTEAHDEYFRWHDVKGNKVARKRSHTIQSNSPLPTVSERLFFILVYLKNNPLQSYHAACFDMSQQQCGQWIHTLTEILRNAIEDAGMLPASDVVAFRKLLDELGGDAVVHELIHDGTEREIPRPSDPDLQKEHYSGKKNQILGEARAIRAFLYFDMVRLWGHIPLFTEPSSENREQADPKDVYALIFSHLKFGMENIPADAYTSADDFGRITKYACEAILARAYLFYNGYMGGDPATVEGTTITKSDALAACEDVIASGRYKLVPEFKNLWPAASLVPLPDGEIGWDPEKSTYAGDANSEVILCQMFTPTQDYNGNNDSNRWLVNIGMRSVNWSPYGKGWGIATISPNYYSSLYTTNDGRRVASVIDMAGEGVTASPDFANAQKDWREYTGYMNKKYTPLVFGNNSTPATNPDGTGDFMITNAQTWVIMRYADVLLMAAELGSGNGGAYLDQVRSRAGLGQMALNQQNIMAERARELAYEGVRYWDLLRQGVEVMADAVCASAGPVLNGGNEAQVSYDRAQIIRTKGLSQIPYNQITLSHGVLKQNEGW